MGIPKLELLHLLLLLASRPPRSSNTSSTQNLNELLVAGLVKMAMKSHRVLLQHYCTIINKHYQLYAITILWPQVNIQDNQASKLVDAPEGIPSFFNKYRYVFEFVSFM